MKALKFFHFLCSKIKIKKISLQQSVIKLKHLRDFNLKKLCFQEKG